LEQCTVSKVTTSVWGLQSFCYSFIAVSMICCSKSAQFTVQVCQVVNVVMETTQMVLSEF